MLIRSMKFALLWISIVIGAAACQSSPIKGLSKVRVGMDKTDVLDTAGNPSYTRRSRGRDRWFYEVYPSRRAQPETREVQFEDGRVVYSGSPLKPEKSADEQDAANAASNQSVNQAESDFQRRRDQAMGISRHQNENEAFAAPSDAYEARFRESTFGAPTDISIEKRKVAPVFTPVE